MESITTFFDIDSWWWVIGCESHWIYIYIYILHHIDSEIREGVFFFLLRENQCVNIIIFNAEPFCSDCSSSPTVNSCPNLSPYLSMCVYKGRHTNIYIYINNTIVNLLSKMITIFKKKEKERSTMGGRNLIIIYGASQGPCMLILYPTILIFSNRN